MSSIYLAPEWTKQDAIIVVWPHPQSDWSDQLASIEITYLELSKYITRSQRLIIICYNEAHKKHIAQTLEKFSVDKNQITFLTIPTNDTWARDYGPLFVKEPSSYKLLDFKFDAYGDKYSHQLDNEFNSTFVNKINLKVPYKSIDLVIEGGNIDINDNQICLSTKNCFERNNPLLGVEFAKLEHDLNEYLGIDHFLWLDVKPLMGDDTDSHIDTLARFCGNDVIVYSAMNSKYDANQETLAMLKKQLEQIKKQNNHIELAPLPMPQPIENNGSQLPASYVNFLITNEYVYVPVFSDKQDSFALKFFDELFPEHLIIDIESNALIQQFGGIHCATMQIPAGVLDDEH